jgi:hypothetical protein
MMDFKALPKIEVSDLYILDVYFGRLLLAESAGERIVFDEYLLHVSKCGLFVEVYLYSNIQTEAKGI